MKKIHDFDIVHDGQQVFRLILKAMSNPLQRVELAPYAEKLYGENKAFLTVAFTLLDNETTFFTFGNTALQEDIVSLTLSSEVDCSHADFIFVEQEDMLKTAIEEAKCGTLADPHKSATIVVKIPQKKDICLTMTGPGIDGTISIDTNAMVEKAVTWRDEMYFEYPQGLDFLFVDDGGTLFTIPRLVKKEG